MAITQYIGARYVPVLADPIAWDNTRDYEPLTIVTYQGDSYTSRQFVPAGVAITNTSYWACTGNFNAQIEAYRQEVARIAQQLGTIETTAGTAASDAQSALTKIGTGFDSTDTVRAAVDAINRLIGTLPAGTVNIGSALSSIAADVSANAGDIDAIETTLTGFDSTHQVKDYIDNSDATLSQAIDALDKDIDRYRKNLTALSDKNFAVASRHFHTGSYSAVQGFCVFDQNGTRYWAQSQLVSDSDGSLEIYSMETHELVGRVTGYFGHMHGMEYINGKIYIDGCVAGTSANYSIVDVSNPAAPSIIQGYTTISTANVVSRVCFVSETKCLLFRGSTGQIWEHDLIAGTDTLVCTLQDTDLYNVVLQNFTHDEELGVYLFGVYQDFSVYVYDSTTGERLNVIRVPVLNYHTVIQELEGACILDGMLYVNGPEPSGADNLVTLLSYDFAHGTVLKAFDLRPASSTNGQYVRCDIEDTASLVNPTQNHFRLANDIVNLMNFYHTNVPLRIHVTGSEYSYRIFLSNVTATLQFDASITLHNHITINEGDVLINGLNYVTFDGANDEQTYAIAVQGGRLQIHTKPTLSGNVTRDIQASYGAMLIIPYNVTFNDVYLNQSVALVKNDTNFNTVQNSIVIVSS